MDNITEQEQPKPERVIQLGQEFQPFDPKYAKPGRSSFVGINNFISQVKLNLGNDLNIPFDVNTSGSKSRKIVAITPFDPEVGYQIDSEDLKLETRLQKIERLKEELNKNIDFQKAPLSLNVSCDSYTLNKLGLNIGEGYSSSKFSQEMLTILRKLRLYAFFPKGRFETRPWEISLGLGEIRFNSYYPIDTGPLPALEHTERNVHEGFYLFLPSDPEKLAQIRARFVMVDEQPDENPNNQAPNTK